jgi:hypothetical protein
VPLDLRSYNVVTYSTEFDEVDDFTTSLRDIGRGRLEGAADFENPVTDFAPADMVPAPSPSRNVRAPRSSDEPVAEEETEERH